LGETTFRPAAKFHVYRENVARKVCPISMSAKFLVKLTVAATYIDRNKYCAARRPTGHRKLLSCEKLNICCVPSYPGVQPCQPVIALFPNRAMIDCQLGHFDTCDRRRRRANKLRLDRCSNSCTLKKKNHGCSCQQLSAVSCQQQLPRTPSQKVPLRVSQIFHQVATLSKLY
jgi:hypothetical protein